MEKELLEKILNKLDKIESRQDEMYHIVSGLEENAKMTRAEQDKTTYTLADIQNKLNHLVQEVEDHDSVINQLRAIK